MEISLGDFFCARESPKHTIAKHNTPAHNSIAKGEERFLVMKEQEKQFQ